MAQSSKEVIDRAGRRGMIVREQRGEAGGRQVLVRLANGQQVQVPAEALRQQGDGGYYIPLDLGELEQQATRSDKIVVPVVEEQLDVGKREVQRGGVRIFTQTTERPVEESVTLREEHARVERRPVDRPATEAELGSAFQEKSVELRETAEEPVVAKTAHVVEEVDVGKEVSTRTETVRDTVRRRDVDVEELPEDLPQSRAGAPVEGKRPSNRR